MINTKFLDGTPTVYRLYDGKGRLIYVGSSFRLRIRLSEHRGTWWWQMVTKAKFQVFPTVEAARAAESVAIQEEEPLCNIIGTGRQAHDKSWPLWTKADWKLHDQWYAEHVRRMDLKQASA